MYRFACFFLLLMAISTINAQTFAPITPNNMSDVVAEMYDYYGTQIQLSPGDLEAFLMMIQTNYNEDLLVPQVQATATGSGFVTWGFATNAPYTAGCLNVVTGNSEISDFTGNQFTFDGLTNGHLHLFAFGTKQGTGQSGLEVALIDPSNIIIIDDKIMYSGECANLTTVAASNNAAFVNLGVPESSFFRVTVAPLPTNTSVVADTFILGAYNSGNMITPQFRSDWSPENGDDSFTNGYISSNRTNTTRFALQKIVNTSGLCQGFRIYNINISLGVTITVDRCTGGRPTPPTPPSNNDSANKTQDIAPNPFDHSTVLNLKDYEIEQAYIQVFDGTGRPVSPPISVPDGASSYSVEGAQLPPGTYFIGLYLPSGTHFFKAVKMSE